MRATVVGAGIVGLCAAWQLAKRGWGVTVVEAGPIPNPHAASFDHHRLMRDFYPGEPGYTARIGEAFDAWEALWRDLGATLYIETGVLALSREAGDWTERCRATLDQTGLAYEVLAPAELDRRHPFLEPNGVRFGLMRPRGGALMAERILGALGGWLRTRG
ncbi:MAG: NAD(P)/FAD-dependent oxidoreductase, partial [Geminicoccaceae bacterium]